MHGDAADAVSADFDLTEMYPGADPQVEPCDTSAERTGTGDGPGRAVERREHPVPGPIDDPPLESADLALGHVMVPVEEPTPLLVAKPRGKVRRSDDVREEHRRERAVDVDVVRALAGDELLDPPERLVAHHVRQVVGSLQKSGGQRAAAAKRGSAHGRTARQDRSMGRIKALLTERPFSAAPSRPFLPPVQRRSEQAAGPRVEKCPARHHWITSSARWSTDCGIVNPRALAVLRLITSSNLVGCSTGRSAGLAPLRILSTNTAARLCRSG